MKSSGIALALSQVRLINHKTPGKDTDSSKFTELMSPAKRSESAGPKHQGLATERGPYVALPHNGHAAS